MMNIWLVFHETSQPHQLSATHVRPCWFSCLKEHILSCCGYGMWVFGEKRGWEKGKFMGNDIATTEYLRFANSWLSYAHFFTELSVALIQMRSEEQNMFLSFFKEKFARLLSSAKPLESFALMNNISYGECLCDFHGVVTPPPTNFDAWRLLLFFAKVHLHTTSCKLTKVGNGSLIQGSFSWRGEERVDQGVMYWTLYSTKWDPELSCLWTITEKTFRAMFAP